MEMSRRADETVSTMSEKIVKLEQALKQIADAKKQLCRNTTEAKSRIQCNMSRQLEALRNREVWLLGQLDVVSGAKEEVLQQQSARLNQTLGLLHSHMQFPDQTGDNTITRNLAKVDLGELQPEETPYVSFKSDPASLREAIMNYGRIDHTSVPPLHSPFMAPNQPAPSLPRHFEDYNDAEHHILYKTVEEINRNKTNEPCVNVNIPRLSNHLEDWLLYPAAMTSASSSTDPKFTFPKLSNNLSDWLRSPVTMTTKPVTIAKTPATVASATSTPKPLTLTSEGRSRPLGNVEGISTDASIKTWLHKIKRNPFDEEEDYDFVEEMSDTRSQYSVEDQMVPSLWLAREDKPLPTEDLHTQKPFQLESLPMDRWLLKSSKVPSLEPETSNLIDMSRYLRSITEELDQWLMTGRDRHDDREEQEGESSMTAAVNERLRPEAPATLTLGGWLQGDYGSRAVNPWLHSTRSAGSFSTVSSRSSSFSNLSTSSSQKITAPNKWLLHGGINDGTATTSIPCSFMDRYRADMDKLAWVKCDQVKTAPLKGVNPLASFEKGGIEMSAWLKAPSGPQKPETDIPSPLKRYLDQQKLSANSVWLLNKEELDGKQEIGPGFEKVFEGHDKIWLMRSQSPLAVDDVEEEDLC